ncbi:unnamed protein product (macronuclear) [Paramecium tetraurelia]|uniref:Transmembrane protein n=1 Tax=Paramecium tetraurelia TaxID=5888 RepID=A0BWT6_PARTE|nr:uncharacterized protein GSPATT00032855001 [Paramecium tetraurelia]CAK63003.1 unnamed protein product [Paramecium tetraurelia]|eukprot:XP_001430401.1 hypothetical protein (macronuclear) [Paramecium tetraurelia strain d4-2]
MNNQESLDKVLQLGQQYEEQYQIYFKVGSNKENKYKMQLKLQIKLNSRFQKTEKKLKNTYNRNDKFDQIIHLMNQFKDLSLYAFRQSASILPYQVYFIQKEDKASLIQVYFSKKEYIFIFFCCGLYNAYSVSLQ